MSRSTHTLAAVFLKIEEGGRDFYVGPYVEARQAKAARTRIERRHASAVRHAERYPTSYPKGVPALPKMTVLQATGWAEVEA